MRFLWREPLSRVDALAATSACLSRVVVRPRRPIDPDLVSCRAVGIDEKEIWGSYSAAVDIKEAADLVLQKKRPVMGSLTHRVPWANIQKLGICRKPRLNH